MSSTSNEEHPIGELFNKLSWKGKSAIIILLLITLFSVLCLLGILPNIPKLEDWGIRCRCNESIAKRTNEEIQKSKEIIYKFSRDTIDLKKQIAELDERIAMALRKATSFKEERDSIQKIVDGLISEKTLLESQLHIAQDSVGVLLSLIDSLNRQNKNEHDLLHDTVKYFIEYNSGLQSSLDSVKAANVIISNVHVSYIKAYTNRKWFGANPVVDEVNIYYTLMGINTLKQYLKNKSFTVVFRIKDQNGFYREVGERNPLTMKSEHPSLTDPISIENTVTDTVTNDVKFPNWQTKFNVNQLFTFETYIQFNEKEFFISASIQNLRLRPTPFSSIEADKKKKKKK